MVRSQINNDGTTTIWNDEGNIHSGMHITRTTTKVSQERLDRLTAERDFNKLSPQNQYLITSHKIETLSYKS